MLRIDDIHAYRRDFMTSFVDALDFQGLQRNSLYNHAEGVYIINAKHCISSTRSVVYHQATGKYTLARDEIQQRLCRCW